MASEVLDIYSLAKGGISSVVVDLRLIFSIALKGNASGFILAHNHPSGNLSHSQADFGITRKLLEAAQLMEITFVDYLIITTTGYASIKELL